MELLLVTRAVYPIHGFGGMERHCYDWVLSLSQLGCRVHVVTLPPEEKTVLSDFPPEVSFYFVPGTNPRSVFQRITIYPAWISRVRKLVAMLTKELPFQAIYANGLVASACTGLEVPLYYNPHGMEEFKCSGLKHIAYTPFRKLSCEAAAGAHKLIATDRSLIPEIRQFFDVPNDKIALIPNSIKVDERISRDSDSARFNPLFLSVGRLERNKGFDVLLHALSMAESLPSDWTACIVGAGKERASLERLALQLGLSNRVKFTGSIPNQQLEELYRNAGLFVHPTLYEGSSIVTLEAMKYGLPILASDTGGLPDKVVPGENGWLVPPNNPTALAAALEKACQHIDTWPGLGMASLRIVLDSFSWNQTGKKFLDLFTG